jgi:dTDP-4-dehydrorhamnose 3,5-epimerase
MELIATKITDVLLLKPNVYKDTRGYFYESFNHRNFEDIVKKKINFVQDNHSKSVKTTLRGLHYQRDPEGQGKLVRCVQGAIWDVAVDLRPNSSTYGKWTADEITSENHYQLWVPAGFAHGFLVLSEEAVVLYKTTKYWSPKHELTICWRDPDLDIPWPLNAAPLISKKDSECALSFEEFTSMIQNNKQ